ncbi:hypothetical protein CHRYSEOSP005_14800 [Chryseobacterium sp. Alg-005]|uniref:hypothetical protein n=1 Tax=Chryseobacterium sp. Alg-005 TaxID=3159516 RepID=UPI00355584C8
MKGNFRIVQESENRFIIEKEVSTYEGHPIRFLGIVIWMKEVKVQKWKKVDKRGIVPCSPYMLLELKDSWYLTLGEAKKALEDIKKYPKVIYIDEYSNIPLPPTPAQPRTKKENQVPKTPPPPPPPPQSPRTVKQGGN